MRILVKKFVKSQIHGQISFDKKDLGLRFFGIEKSVKGRIHETSSVVKKDLALRICGWKDRFLEKMYAVGRLGSYITQGVYTVSGPFHPFGGAVDVIVVEQQDGTFKSSPWYVRFGKFQGVLKSKEKVVDISVDGVQSDFHMYLDHRGQAYFNRELECEEDESLFEPLSSGEDTDIAVLNRRPLKSMSVNYRAGSRRSRILGLVFGSNSMKESSFREEKDVAGVVRADSLERAEIAADLLEMKWSTNLGFSRYKKENGDILANEADEDLKDGSNSEKGDGTGLSGPHSRSRLRFQKLGSSDEEFGVEISSLNNEVKENGSVLDSPTIKGTGKLVLVNVDHDKNGVPKDKNGGEVIFEVNSLEESTLLVAKEPLDSPSILVDNYFAESFSRAPPNVKSSSNSVANGIAKETCNEAMKVERKVVSENSSDLRNSSSRETSSNSVANANAMEICNEAEKVERKVVSENSSDVKNSSSRETVTTVPIKKLTISPLRDLEEEEILLFGELDDPNYNKDVFPEVLSSTQIVEDDSPSDEKESLKEDVGKRPKVVSSCINIPKRDKFEGFDRTAESLPIMWPLTGDIVLDNLQHPLGHSLDSNLEVSRHNASLEDIASCIKPDVKKDDEVTQPDVKDSVPNSTPVGCQSVAADPSNVKWRVWPFSFRRTQSLANPEQIRRVKKLDAESNLESTICREEEKDAFKPKGKKTKKVRVLTPTPEQLASLKLKEGMNTVTFTFKTSMLGPQQVDARIFLWKWDTRIVISDVDGTITKSDVLGQFMPMVGMDWSHSGVAHLFSAIKENGYQLLFLSARAISQAHLTRQFLFNLKQDGKALPEGPVVISPDGLFPSLFREVIRRAPHEFKIACLEDIKALFPSDRSPFYAGFGNRDTDEFSYLKVGIPIGKIFIINPKGEVVVNRRVDRKSYTSLKALVHDMFPPTSSSEQEDYNAWNFWKLPPPLIDV